MIRRVALLEPLGDPGIGTYAYELATALTGAGVAVDLYTNAYPWIGGLPRTFSLYPVLGSALAGQRQALRTSRLPASASGGGAPSSPSLPPTPRAPGRLKQGLRSLYLPVELAAFLRIRGYDLAWTQWPDMGGGWLTFWEAARALGVPVVHTAHNVFPHERAPGDRERYGGIYRQSRAVLVHSAAARRSLLEEYPSIAPKALVSPHGLYTSYPRRPEARGPLRQRLGIAPDAPVVLCFGGVRPYKNVDAVIGAVAADSAHRFTLIVAGHEAHYPDSDPKDPLAHCRRLARELGVGARVHLVAGPFDYPETSELFEAADIVALPYLESYGSGQLLLAMSFGKYVIATRTGGMEEYLARYPDHAIVEGTGSEDVLSALRQADQNMQSGGRGVGVRPPEYEWSRAVRDLLPRLEAQL